MMKNRDNYEHSNRWVINTVRVLSVITQNAPECCRASDIAQLLEIDKHEAEEILINLCIEEIARETEHGFQTMCGHLGKLNPTSHRILDDYLMDFYYGKMPEVRDADGNWVENRFPLNSQICEFKNNAPIENKALKAKSE